MKNIIIGYKDKDGIPRAYAWGKLADKDVIAEVAHGQLLAYIKSKPYDLSTDDFTKYQSEYTEK